MANSSTRAHSKSSESGKELTLHHQETDSPILPVAQLEQLHNFRPDLVDFVVNETRNEAEHRRGLERFGYKLTFAERVLGQICAVIVSAIGMGGAIYLGIMGHDWLAGVIATAMISGLAVAFIASKKSKTPS